MRVIAFDPYSPEATHDSLDKLVADADVVSMHATATPETVGMMGAEQFAAMAPGSVYLNTARAALHDLDALTEALQSGHLGGAGLDHFEGEQLAVDDPVAGLDNVVLTPHIGGATYDTEINHTAMIADDIGRVLRGERPMHCANPEVPYERLPTMNNGNDKPNGRPLPEVLRPLAAAKAMYRRSIVEGTAGNVSGRVDDGSVVVTPSSLDYEAMVLDDLVVMDLDGAVVAGERSPTSEKVHLAALAAHPEAGAVVHCHAKHASMFAVAHQPISRPSTSSSSTSVATSWSANTTRRAATSWGRWWRPRSAIVCGAHGQPRTGHHRQVGGGRCTRRWS